MPSPASPAPGNTPRFRRFADFYPFYLSEHQHPVSRRLHVVGSTLVLLIVAASLLTGRYAGLLGALLLGYGFAWAGHFFFEKNRPATFRYPLYSFVADFVMLKDVLARRIPW